MYTHIVIKKNTDPVQCIHIGYSLYTDRLSSPLIFDPFKLDQRFKRKRCSDDNINDYSSLSYLLGIVRDYDETSTTFLSDMLR